MLLGADLFSFITTFVPSSSSSSFLNYFALATLMLFSVVSFTVCLRIHALSKPVRLYECGVQSYAAEAFLQ